MGSNKKVEKLSTFVELALFCFRLYFYVYVMFDLYISRDQVEYYYLAGLWTIAAMFIPLSFWVPFLINKRMFFCFTELLLSGSLSIYAMEISKEVYSNMFIIPTLTIAMLIEKRYYWLIGILALFPFIQIGMKGFPQNENPYMYLFNHWFIILIGFGVNRIIDSYKKTEQLNRLIEEKNQTLVQYAKQIETFTQVEERNRMARDLHDTLGHSFISYILGLDAIHYLIDSKPDEAKKKIEELRLHASASLDQIRETIHQIGTNTEIQLKSNFSTIINEFSKYTNTKVNFNVYGEEYTLLHPIRMALLRCLQECLTNAKRHGFADEISIQLSFLDDQVALRVDDNGLGMDEVSFGFGLTSLKERIETLNGEVQIKSSMNEGTSVFCKIPYRR